MGVEGFHHIAFIIHQDHTAAIGLEQPFVGIPYQAVRPCDILGYYDYIDLDGNVIF